MPGEEGSNRPTDSSEETTVRSPLEAQQEVGPRERRRDEDGPRGYQVNELQPIKGDHRLMVGESIEKRVLRSSGLGQMTLIEREYRHPA
jgi:hypothetical protein